MKFNIKNSIQSFSAKFGKSMCLLLAFIVLCSHDLYLKMDSYFLEPNQEATLSLYNGTFENSENIITRDRMLDASVVAQGKRTAIDPNNWKDQDSIITQLTFKTGKAGTYVVGVSTKARNIELTAEKFNSYLKNDGVLDMLKQRTNYSLLDQDAVEDYQKHVKAIYQVGNVKTDDWKTVLGYPIEFVPQTNPYDKYSGETLDVQLLLDGKPLANQLIFADYIKSGHKHDGVEHSHDDLDNNDAHANQHRLEQEHTHTNGQQLRTNDKGVITVELPEDGIYYLRTIYMTRATDSDKLTHRSKWATLTFEVSHAHGKDSHTHNDEHDNENGVPTWVFILGSIIIIGALFLIFRKKDN